MNSGLSQELCSKRYSQGHTSEEHSHTHKTGGEKLLDVVLGGALGFSVSSQVHRRDLRPPPTELVMVRPFPPLNTNFGLQLERRVRDRNCP